MKGGYTVVRCRACSHVFVANVPRREQLAEFYGLEYFKDGQKSIEGDGRIEYERSPACVNNRRRLHEVRQYVQHGRLFEVGCGAGGFLREAAAFFDVEGSDISVAAARLASEQVEGQKVRVGDLLDLDLPGARYDAVVMFDVLEHLEQPGRSLAEVHRILRPGGVVYLTTPAVDSLAFRLGGRNWHLMTPPEHLGFFSQRTARRLLREQGFRLIGVRYPGQLTNVSYVLRKLRRVHGAKWWLRALEFGAEATRLGRASIYLNLWDVMAIAARKEPGTSDGSPR